MGCRPLAERSPVASIRNDKSASIQQDGHPAAPPEECTPSVVIDTLWATGYLAHSRRYKRISYGGCGGDSDGIEVCTTYDVLEPLRPDFGTWYGSIRKRYCPTPAAFEQRDEGCAWCQRQVTRGREIHLRLPESQFPEGGPFGSLPAFVSLLDAATRAMCPHLGH